MENAYLDEMLLLAIDLAKAIRENEIVDDCRLSGAVLRMAPKLDIALENLEEDTTLEEARTYVYEAEYALEEMCSNMDDDFVGYLMCDSIYELAYNYEAYESPWLDDNLNKEGKELHRLLWNTLAEHEMYKENCGGAYAIMRRYKG